MLNRLPLRPKFITSLCLLMLVTAALSAQTFRIESVENNTVNALDSTQVVTYTVRLENATQTLNNVVPTLTPPACSFTNGASYFSASYAGSNGFLVPTAIGSWANNTTKDLSFYVHLYNLPELCDNSGGVCSPEATLFEMSLTHDASLAPTTAQDADDHLLIRTPGEPVYNLDHLVYGWNLDTPDECLFMNNGTEEFELPFDFNELNIDRNDPATKVVIGVNWTLPQIGESCPAASNNDPLCPFFLAFGIFKVAVSNVRAVDVHAATIPTNEGLMMISEPVLGLDGQVANQAPYGGTQVIDCVTDNHSTNFWDITDLDVIDLGNFPDQTVIEAIAAPSTPDPVTMSCRLGGGSVPIFLRSVGIYVATNAQCAAADTVFGAPPAAEEFHIGNYEVASNGIASADLTVPAAWQENGLLKDDFSVEWFLVGDSVLTSILNTGSGNSDQSLEAEFNILNEIVNLESLGLTVTDLQLMARIKNEAGINDAFVSTKTEPHNLSYSSSDFFENEEIGVGTDPNLDPGESRIYTYSLNNISSNSISGATLNVDFSLVGDSIFAYNGQLVNSSDSISINLPSIGAGSTRNETLDFQLIQTSTSCADITIPVTVSFSNGMTDFSYTNRLAIAANCGVKEFTITDMSGWVAQIFELNNGTETEITPVPGSIEPGWFFDAGTGQWEGTTNLPIYFYTLTSPPLPTGLDGTQSLSIQHTHRFPSFRSGGVLEYRLENGFWQDLVVELEDQGPIYNVLEFPDLDEFFDIYLTGRNVWMGTPFESESVVRDIPSGLFAGDDTVEFSFLFQDPRNENEFSEPWDLESFSYTYTDLITDDYFRVSGVPVINEKVCNDPVAVDAANTDFNYTYQFYTSAEDLLNNLPNETNTTGDWQPPLPDNPPAVYYIKVSADNSTNPATQIQRIFPIQVSAGSDCDPCGNLDRNDDGTLDAARITTDWPSVIITDLAGVINLAVSAKCSLSIPNTAAPAAPAGRGR